MVPIGHEPKHLEYLAGSQWADALQTVLLPWLESAIQIRVTARKP
jgi:hypothetical protein